MRKLRNEQFCHMTEEHLCGYGLPLLEQSKPPSKSWLLLGKGVAKYTPSPHLVPCVLRATQYRCAAVEGGSL